MRHTFAPSTALPGFRDGMLETAILDKLLARALRHGGDYADVFCERRRSYAFRLQDGHIHEGQSAITQGVGIRVVIGETAGYAYSDDLSLEALLRAAEAASLVARTLPAGKERRINLTALSVPPLYDQDRKTHADASRYVALLETADAAARKYDSRIVAVNAHVTDELQDVWIATSDGRYVHDHRPMVTLGVQAVASRNGERGSGYVGDGGRTSIAYFDDGMPQAIAGDAARIATTNLEAVAAPAGEMEMVVGAGGGGVLLHEAVGHGLESDFNRRGTSLYSRARGRTSGERTRHHLRRRKPARRTRQHNGRRRGRTRATQSARRARRASRLHARYVERPFNGRAADRQRPASIVPLSAAAAHVQHVHAQRRLDRRRNHRVDEARDLREVVRGRTSRNQQGRLRLHGCRRIPHRKRQGHDAGEERDHRRQRPRCR